MARSEEKVVSVGEFIRGRDLYFKEIQLWERYSNG